MASPWHMNFALLNQQNKHLIAFWKSKAKALEYENEILHDIIKKNNLFLKTTLSNSDSDSEGRFICYDQYNTESDQCESESEHFVTENDQNETESDQYESESDEYESENELFESECEQYKSADYQTEEEHYAFAKYYKAKDDQGKIKDDEYYNAEDIEASNEFIEFLKKNEKFKETVRLEKEKFRKERGIENEEERILRMEAPPVKKLENNTYKDIYGTNWEKICVLELSMECSWIETCAKYRASYWPNIPLNLN